MLVGNSSRFGFVARTLKLPDAWSMRAFQLAARIQVDGRVSYQH